MSWQSHVDTLTSGDNFESVAIVEADGGKKVAGSDGFDVTPEEVTAAAKALAEGADKRREVQIAGGDYSVMSQVPGTIYGRRGYTGCVIQKTKETIVFGVFPGNKNRDARFAIDKLVDDISKSG